MSSETVLQTVLKSRRMSHGARSSGKCVNACNYCRLKKIKCNGGPRCSNCITHNEECVFPPLHRRNRSRLWEENRALVERIARMEALLRNRANSPVNDMAGDFYGQQAADGVEKSPIGPETGDITMGLALHVPQIDHRTLEQLERGVALSAPDTSGSQSFDLPPYTEFMSSLAGLRKTNEESSVHGRNSTSGDDGSQRSFSPQNSVSEHHGPSSFLSICSEPGLNWITERTGVTDFTEYARALTADISRNLKLGVNRVRERAPELDAQIAWKYTNTYFEESPEVAAGVVNKPAFEARLRAHFDTSQKVDDDPAWYALRHTVYASACRLEWCKSNNSNSFAETQAQAWRHFENALSVNTELLYSPTTLMVVETLLAMTSFVEGLGSPALEYMLCSSAVRLAQSKGLHLQPTKSMGLDEDEILTRNWMFWSLYIYEKHISYRSGRPSAIDDDDVSCEIPTKIPTGSAINIELLTACTTHARLSSKISKRLATVKAYEQTPRELVQTVFEMDQLLEEWAKTLPPHLHPRSTIKPTKLPTRVHLHHVMYLKYSYYGSVLAIHTIFTYPWTSAIIRTDQSPAFRNQVALSTKAVVEASRSIILTTKYIDVDASSPVWLAFYYPFVGLINLFLYILRYPESPTANSDIALMDIVAGHFGQVEFLTASIFSFPFIREITNLASTMVKRTRNRNVEPPEYTSERADPTSSGLMDEPMSSFGMGNLTDFGTIDMSNFDLENWGSFTYISPVEMDAMNMDGSLSMM